MTCKAPSRHTLVSLASSVLHWHSKPHGNHSHTVTRLHGNEHGGTLVHVAPQTECFSLPPSILSSRWEKFTWPTERLQIWVMGQRQCMCVTWIKSILSISFLKISPVPPVMLPPTHQMHAPESRRLPEIDLNLRGNYFPRDLFVCFFFFFSLSDWHTWLSQWKEAAWLM